MLITLAKIFKMEQVPIEQIELKDFEKLKDHLERYQIKRSAIYSTLDKTRAWMTYILNGTIGLSEENKKAIEEIEIMKITGFKF